MRLLDIIVGVAAPSWNFDAPASQLVTVSYPNTSFSTRRHGSSDKQRIDARVVPTHSPMKMGTGCTTRCAHGAYALPLANTLTKLHIDAGQVKKRTAEAMTMIDHQQIPFQREWSVGGQNHDTVGGSEDWISGRSGNVDAAMVAARHALINPLRSK